MDAGYYWVRDKNEIDWEVARRGYDGRWWNIGIEIPVDCDKQMEIFYEIGERVERNT